MSDDNVVNRLDALIALIFENLKSQAKIPQAQLFKTLRDTGLSPAELEKFSTKKGNTLVQKSQSSKNQKQRIQKIKE